MSRLTRVHVLLDRMLNVNTTDALLCVVGQYVLEQSFQSGLFFDSHISTGRLAHEEKVPENGIIQSENYYEPRHPPGDPNGMLVWTSVERWKFLRCRCRCRCC